MTVTRLKVAAAVLLALGAAGAGTAGLGRRPHDGTPQGQKAALGPVSYDLYRVLQSAAVGDYAEADAWQALASSGALHLYGKAESRPGRKMGHVTRLKPRS